MADHWFDGTLDEREARDSKPWLFEDETSELADVSCPECASDPTYLGTLGSRTHFRCRACGLDYSV